jgi:hypothetical protein
VRDKALTEPVYGWGGIRHERWPELAKEAVKRNMGTRVFDANGQATSGNSTRARVRMWRFRGETARSSYEVPDKRMEQRRCIKEPDSMSQPVDGRSPMKKAKPFCISKKEIWEAYHRVKANKGAAGTDNLDQSLLLRAVKKHGSQQWMRQTSLSRTWGFILLEEIRQFALSPPQRSCPESRFSLHPVAA